MITVAGSSQNLIPRTHWLVVHGDSITAGFGCTNRETGNYGNVLRNSLETANPNWRVGYLNLGINGQGLDFIYSVPPSNSFGTLTQDAVTRVDPILNETGSKYLVIFAGTNDIFLKGTSANNTWALMQNYLNARISAGWTIGNICVCTMLPRQSMNEAQRIAYNTHIRNNASVIGYKLGDLAASNTIGQSGNENNTVYYSDTIHLKEAGHLEAEPIIRTALFG